MQTQGQEPSPKNIETTTVNIEREAQAEPANETENDDQAPLRALMDAAAGREEPSCFGPFVTAGLTFEAVTEDAYQGWVARLRVWGCLTASLLSLLALIPPLLAATGATASPLNTHGALFAIATSLRVIGALP